MSDELSNALENEIILPPLTECIKALPLDERGHPVFYHGQREAQASRAKWRKCEAEKLCWLCGQKMGRYLAYVCRTAGVVARVVIDPPMHADCAEWLVRGGVKISRRPEHDFDSVMCVWIAGGHARINHSGGNVILRPGLPTEPLHWRLKGRAATKNEVAQSLAQALALVMTKISTMEEGPQKTRAADDLQAGFDWAMTQLPRH